MQVGQDRGQRYDIVGLVSLGNHILGVGQHGERMGGTGVLHVPVKVKGDAFARCQRPGIVKDTDVVAVVPKDRIGRVNRQAATVDQGATDDGGAAWGGIGGRHFQVGHGQVTLGRRRAGCLSYVRAIGQGGVNDIFTGDGTGSIGDRTSGINDQGLARRVDDGVIIGLDQGVIG